MADKSIREQIIIDKVIPRLQTILKTNGYITNLGQYVYHFLQTDQEADKLPSVNVRDITGITEHSASNWHDKKIALELHVKTSSGSTTIQTIYDLTKDILSAINVDETWGSIAIATHLISDEIDMDQKAQIIGGVIIKIEIEYGVAAWTF